MADGNRASVELICEGVWHDGRNYRSPMHVSLDIANGQVVGYREFFDTVYDDSFFGSVEPVDL